MTLFGVLIHRTRSLLRTRWQWAGGAKYGICSCYLPYWNLSVHNRPNAEISRVDSS